MSAIFGRFHFDDSPVYQSTLLAMQQAMSYWGTDGDGTWCENHMGLGHLRRNNTPESAWDCLPFVCPASDNVITASARLDNRDALLQTLAMPRSDWDYLPDSHIILAAYRLWGEAVVERLIGDWAFAIWDAGKRKLFIARDHHGNTGLYYYSDSRSLSFASSLKGLLVLPNVPQRPNPLTIAQVLVAWPIQGKPTCYEGIFRLPPAHALTVTSEGVKVKQYWHLEHTPELHLKKDAEYVDAFLEVYTEAVRCRLRCSAPVGVTLSGGLDSGSVAAIAARDLREKSLNLTAFSSVPTSETEGLVGSRMGDETPLISATAQFVGNIELNYIYAREVSPLDGIRQALSIHDQPLHAVGNMYWINALMAEARRRGLGAVLTGQGGNNTISWSGGPELVLLDYLASAQFGTFNKKLGTLRKENRHSLWSAVKGQVIRPLLWRTGQAMGRLKPSKEVWRNYSAINLAFAKELDLSNQMERAGHDPTFSPKRDLRQLRLTLLKPGKYIGGHLWSETGAAYGLEIRDPTLDQRVMSFCWSIPENQYNMDGQNRMLIRRAMRDYLPDKVLWNRKKGRQSADISQRIVENRSDIDNVLSKLERSELARYYLNLPKMRTAFESVQHKIDGKSYVQSSSVLLRGLMVGLFLLRFD